MRVRTATSVLAVLVALGTGAGACTSAEPVATTPETRAPITTAPPVTLSATQTQEVLTAGLLTATDLGDGWSETSAPQEQIIDADTFSFMLAEPSCAKVLEAITQGEAQDKVVSPRFGKDTQTASNSVTVMKSERKAELLVLAISKEASDECLQNAFTKGLTQVYEAQPGLKVTSVRIDKLTGLTVGSLRAGFEVTLDTREGDGSITTIVVTRVAAQVGAAVLDFTFGSEQFPFPDPATVMQGPVDRVEAIVTSSTTTTAAGS